MANILVFKPLLYSERLGESAYDREEREAREFYALPKEERKRSMDAKVAAILERTAKKRPDSESQRPKVGLSSDHADFPRG
jgi:hypothetical protein